MDILGDPERRERQQQIAVHIKYDKGLGRAPNRSATPPQRTARTRFTPISFSYPPSF